MTPGQSPYKYLAVQRVGKVTMVVFTGRAILDEKTIQLIGDELMRLLEKFGSKNILLNFAEVRNLGSYMLATLVNLDKKLKAAGGRLALCSIDPEVYQVFELTNLTKILKIYPNETDALKSF